MMHLVNQRQMVFGKKDGWKLLNFYGNLKKNGQSHLWISVWLLMSRNPRINATIINTNATSQLISIFLWLGKTKCCGCLEPQTERALWKRCQKRKELQLASAQVLNVKKEMQAFKDSQGNQKMSLKNLKEAEISIVAFCQLERFPDEIAALTSKNPVISRSSSIYKMDLFYQKSNTSPTLSFIIT